MCHRQENCFMTIPYRVRRGLRRFFVAAGILTLIAVLALIVWMLWLSRYVVYTDDGAKLDFSLVFGQSQGELATPPASRPTVPISFGEDDSASDLPDNALAQLSGYTVSTEMLTDHLDEVKTVLQALPSGSAVMLDVKNVRGEFFYTSSLGRNPAGMDTKAITELIKELSSKGHHVIARLPAFRDFWYFIDDETARVPYGLPKANGTGSLWEDKSIKNMTHYWFNPVSNGTLNYLVQIVTELRSLGFDEVLFSDFRFPDTDGIRFEGDKTAALNKAAKTLVQACTSDTFTVSFMGTHFALPEGRCRVYLESAAAVDIPQILTGLDAPDAAAQLVFLTDLMDTRYEDYGVLRPVELLMD